MSEDIFEQLKSVYGSLEEPTYFKINEVMDQRPYARLVQELTNFFQVEEITDVNEDVSFQYELILGDDRWMLELSAVGPYAVFSRYEAKGRRFLITLESDDLEPPERQVADLLRRHGLRVMGRLDLDVPVRMNLFVTELEKVCLYHALFSDNDSLPWG
ncbi:MAG: hypothetical protein LC799_28995 [Actinobacteria bacterium]|nr:hypothetical protein [Actinomycetota bacterium]